MDPISAEKMNSMLAREKRAVGVVATIATLRLFGLFALLPVLSRYAGELEGALRKTTQILSMTINMLN